MTQTFPRLRAKISFGQRDPVMSRLTIGIVAAVLAGGAAIAADPPRPVAMVGAVSNAPAAKVQAFDYIYPGTEIDLRPSGALTIAWFDSCVLETVTGGQVRLEKARARVSSGGKATQTTRACPTSALKLAPSRSEAGVAVKRVTPFEEGRWSEITVAAARPTFLWPSAGPPQNATVIVSYLDEAPKREVWRGTASAPRLEYPAAAPALTPGAPYEVVVERAGATPYRQVFSVDPGLTFENEALAKVVPLGL